MNHPDKQGQRLSGPGKTRSTVLLARDTTAAPEAGAPPTRDVAGRLLAPRLLLALAVVLAVVAYAAAFRGRYVDDAYIQLAYAQALVTDGTWGLSPGRVANTATSPLNVMVTAVVGLALGSLVDAAYWLIVVELLALLGVLLLLSRGLVGHAYFGVFAFVAFATNPLLLSTLGLELLLYTLLFVVSLYLCLTRRWLLMALALALLTLARPDGALLFVLLLVLAPASLRTKGLILLLYALALLPWHLYSWIHLGSLVPDTLFLKKAQPAWSGHHFAEGLRIYWGRYRLATAAAFFLLPLGVLPLVLLWRSWWRDREQRRIIAAVAGYGLIHFGAYAILKVPPYHWYYVHAMIAVVFLGSLGLTTALQRGLVMLPHRAVATGVRAAAPLIPAAWLIALGVSNGFPFREPPIHTNWATPAAYEEIGRWLRDNVAPGATVELSGEIGTLAFYSERRLVNEFSDLNITTAIINDLHYTERPLVGPLFRANLRWRKPQDPLPPATYLLQHIPHDVGQAPPEGVVRSWDTATRWVPSGRLSLIRPR